jgi:hypothetical protein
MKFSLIALTLCLLVSASNVFADTTTNTPISPAEIATLLRQHASDMTFLGYKPLPQGFVIKNIDGDSQSSQSYLISYVHGAVRGIPQFFINMSYDSGRISLGGLTIEDNHNYSIVCSTDGK